METSSEPVAQLAEIRELQREQVADFRTFASRSLRIQEDVKERFAALDRFLRRVCWFFIVLVLTLLTLAVGPSLL